MKRGTTRTAQRICEGSGAVIHSADEYVRARRNPYEHGRRLLLDFQARHEGRVSALQRSTCIAIWRSLIFDTATAFGLGVDDKARADRALEGIVGKRLTYRIPYVTAAK